MQELDFHLSLDWVCMVQIKELGRHRGREGKVECSLCRDVCKCESHVLWECSA